MVKTVMVVEGVMERVVGGEVGEGDAMVRAPTRRVTGKTELISSSAQAEEKEKMVKKMVDHMQTCKDLVHIQC